MAVGMFNIQDVVDDNPFTGVVAPNPRGVGTTIRETSGFEIPSDLLIDTDIQREFFQDFMEIFRESQAEDDGRLERQTQAAEWLRVLGEYAIGQAELSELEAVDVSDLMEIEGFEDYYYGIVPRKDFPEDTTTDTETTEDKIVDGVNVTDLERKYGKEVVDAIFDTAGEAIDIIKQTAEDPQAAIDKFIDTYGTKTKTGSWKDWTEVGVFGGIAGIPLPPGFIGGTVRELEDKLKEVGATISDVFSNPEETLEKIGKWVTDTVDSVLNGTADSPWGTSTIDSIGGWIIDILGPTLGSTILSTTSSAIETSIQDAISIGGVVDTDDEEDDSTDQFNKLLGTVQDTLETDDVVDIGADSTLDDNTTTTVGGDPNSTDVFSSLLDTVTSNLEVTDTEKTDDTVVVGGDLNDSDDDDYPARGTYASAYCETRGEDGGTLVTSYHDGAGGTYTESSFSSVCKKAAPVTTTTTVTPTTTVTSSVDDDIEEPIIVGGVIDDSLNYDDEPVIEIGGTEEPEAATGGGGSVGGGQASATPFMKLVPYTRTVPLALQPSMPTNYASGLMAAPTMAPAMPIQASGLMSPSVSMDALGQLLLRNMKA